MKYLVLFFDEKFFFLMDYSIVIISFVICNSLLF